MQAVIDEKLRKVPHLKAEAAAGAAAVHDDKNIVQRLDHSNARARIEPAEVL